MRSDGILDEVHTTKKCLIEAGHDRSEIETEDVASAIKDAKQAANAECVENRNIQNIGYRRLSERLKMPIMD